MNSRAAILARIARRAGHGLPAPPATRASVGNDEPAVSRASASVRPDATVPERASGEPAPALAERVARFTKLAAATQMTVARIATRSAVPAAVRDYLRDGQDVPGIVADQTLDIAAADWRRAGLEFSDGDTRPDGDTYISAGLAALAECGAVVIASGPGRALRNDFLARTHIVVVAVDRLLPTFADLWTLLRNRSAGEQLPRELCLITGPSRTADLGVPAKLGAHGPARVHVLLVDAW